MAWNRPNPMVTAGLMLMFGTLSSLTSKAQILMEAQGFADVRHLFEKPVFQTLVIFGGCALGLPLGTIWGPTGTYRLRSFEFRDFVVPIVSSALAVVAMSIEIAGLVRVNLSVYQMLRGALTIFSTLFSAKFLKRTFHAYQLVGIALLVVALIVVGVASCLMTGFDARWTWKDRLIGSLLIVFGQVLQGGQLVFDEYMSQCMGLPPLFIIGMEGVWGLFLDVLIAIPLVSIIPGSDPSPFGGSLEYIGDTFLMLAHSWKLSLTVITMLIVVGCSCMCAMTVTATMSSVHRTILEALRTLTVFVSMIFIGFWSDFGEKWVVWSWLELAGFMLLVYSSLVFNNIVRLPFMKYPK